MAVADGSQLRYARLAGLMYLVVLVLDIAGALITSGIVGQGSFVETSHRIAASELLYRIGLTLALLGSLSTVLLAIGLYATLKPVDPNLALTGLVFRAAEAAIGGMGIALAFVVLHTHLAVDHGSAFSAGQLGALADLSSSAASTQVSAIFFSLGSTVFFYVFLRSSYIPRLLAGWGVFASAVYAAVWLFSLVLPQDSSVVVGVGSVPILIAEVATGLWLLIAGIRLR
jgi:hypothetical protein